jgi:hypothetical protein
LAENHLAAKDIYIYIERERESEREREREKKQKKKTQNEKVHGKGEDEIIDTLSGKVRTLEEREPSRYRVKKHSKFEIYQRRTPHTRPCARIRVCFAIAISYFSNNYRGRARFASRCMTLRDTSQCTCTTYRTAELQ